MLATFTLATTTFAVPVLEADSIIFPASLTGLQKGTRLFANREMMQVEYLTGISGGVKVQRAVNGTMNRPHATSETVYVGPAYQFFETDPQGVPLVAAFVNPHINVLTGTVWVVQGDDVGPGAGNRQWVPVTTAYNAGDLGVRVATMTTPT